MQLVNPPFPTFNDSDGKPLEDGYIYIGVADQNPETNPISVYWDAAGKIPAAQPIRTSGGYAVRNGSPAAIYTDINYSITVKDKKGALVYYASNSESSSVISSRTIYVPDMPGVDATGATDSTLGIAAIAAAAQSGDTFDFGGGTYLVSYQGVPYSSAFGNVVMDFIGKTDLNFIGNGATIKVVDHNITVNGGLRFANFKGCKRINFDGLNFDMTFIGTNTSASYYPFCGAITAIDDATDGQPQSALNSDFVVEACSFKLYHPYGQYVTTSAPYSGDPNNGYKLFSFFASGPYLGSSYESQCRNVTIKDCVHKKGHNGYGFWVWAWNNVNVINNVAEDWVGKRSTTAGAVAGTGVAFIRYHQFLCSGLIIDGNSFRAKPSSERTTSGFQGAALFAALDTNQTGDYSHGESVVANNTIVLGNGDAANSLSDFGVAIYVYGQVVVEGNTFDGFGESSNAYGGTCVYYSAESVGGNGSGSLIVDGNTFGRNCSYLNNITLGNGSNINEYNRRCKSLVVTNNVSLSQLQYFLDMSANSATTNQGVRQVVVTGNTVDGTHNTVWNSASANSRAINYVSSNATDEAVIANNQILNKYYGLFSSFGISNAPSVYNNTMQGVTTNTASLVDSFRTNTDGSTFYKTAAVDLTAAGTAQAFNIGGVQVGTLTIPSATEVYLNATAVSSAAGLQARDATNNTKSLLWIPFNGGLYSTTDGVYNLGRSNYRWNTVYATTGTINTSDEREKQQVQDIDEAVLRAWSKVNYCKFKYNDAVEKKGDGARWHFGVIAQRVKEAFESEGLDAFSYGILCYDEWEDDVRDVLAEDKYTDEHGDEHVRMVSTGEKEILSRAGNRYGIRYDEALVLECALLRWKLNQLTNQ